MNKDKYNEMSPPPEEGDRRQLQHRSGGRVGGPWGVFEDAGVDKVRLKPGTKSIR